MRGKGRFRNAGIVVSAICVLASLPAWGQSRDELETFIESVAGQAAGAVLPPGVDDIVAALQASPEASRVTLIVWLDSRIRNAAEEGDFDRVDRYQAFRTCLDTRGADCSLLRQLQNTGAWQGKGEPAATDEEGACLEGVRYNYDRCKAGGTSEEQCSYERSVNLSRC
jgi:hypothetical protein